MTPFFSPEQAACVALTGCSRLSALGGWGTDLRTMIIGAAVALALPCALAAAIVQDALPPAFGASVDAPAKSSSTGGNKLKLFPPKEGDDVTASNQELVEMFKKNFVEAAGNLSRQATGG